MKKLLQLTLLLVAILLPATSFAYSFKANGIYYDITSSNDKTVCVTYIRAYYQSEDDDDMTYVSDYSGHISIPSTVTYNGTTYSVTSINDHAFDWSDQLTSVYIPTSVTTIGEEAFSYCYRLEDITIPNSIISIGNGAFYGCEGLSHVYITDLEAWCKINFDYPTWQYGWSSYYANPLFYAHHLYLNGQEIKDLVIPNTITTIKKEAFRGCSGLTSVTIPSSVTSIASGAFVGCSGLTKVNISSIEAWCNISISSNPLSNAHHLYCNGVEINNLTIPNSVTAIKDNAFNGCSEITSLYIPSSVQSIGVSAFEGCNNLSSITVSSSNTNYDSRDNCNALIKTSSNSLILGCQNTSIPNSVTTIGSSAFKDRNGLTSVTIPNSVTSVAEYAFSGCKDLSSVVIGNSVSSIGTFAFYGCSGLSSIVIGNSVTTYGSSPFVGCTQIKNLTWNAKNCISNGNMPTANIEKVTIGNQVESLPSNFVYGSKITNVTIPCSVKSIGSSAFYGCALLERLNFNAIFCTDFSSSYYSSCYLPFNNSHILTINIGDSVQRIPTYFAYNLKDLANLTIPNSVTTIGSSAFSGCSGITSLTIPNSVTTIGSSAFSGCSGITSLTIPNSVTTIGSSAFSGCSGITSLTIPNSITTISNSTFSGCSGITSVTIPNSVMSIGNSAFMGCSGLIDVAIGSSVTSINNYAFQGCTSLETLNYNAINCNDFSSTNSYRPFYNLNISNIIIGDNVQRIPAYFANGLSQLDSVVLSSSVSSIGCYSFDNTGWYNRQPDGVVYLGKFTYNYKGTMPNDTSITIRNGIMGIADYAFYGKTKLTGITIPNTVTSIGTSAFMGCSNIIDLAWNAKNCSSIGEMPTSNIEHVTIGDEVETLPNNFVSGSKIANVVIPNAIKSISNSSFENCSALHDITIGSGLTTINTKAFNGCNIKTLRYNAVNCNSIATDAFNADLILSSLQFGDSVRYIPAGLPTFDMTGSNLLIPNSVQSIATGALSDGVCDAVVIGNGLDTLEAGTFSEGIKIAYVSNAEPIPSAPAAFGDPQTLYVPGGSKVKYWTAQGWNEFKEIIQGPYIPVDALAIDSVISMPKGATRQLAATISPTDATATSIKWFSKDSTIATVDNNGIIQAINHGETDIYAVVDTVMAICHVNVNVALVESLTLNAEQLLLEPDAIFTLTATANPDYAENQAVEWEIPENDVIVHFINGNSINIGTLQEGTVTVTAHTVDGSNLSASCTITVNQNIMHVTSVELDRTSAGMNEGETLQLTATVMPEDATDKTVSWASSDETVATVDQNGLVTAVAAGTATITASTIDGSDLSASCEVTVNGIATVNNSLDADALSARCGEEKQLAVRMDNESSITALQCDIYLPEGISIATQDGDYLIDLVPARKATNHTVSTNDLSNGAIRLFITSATSKPFKGNSGDLFILNLVVDGDAESGEYSLDLRNIILSDTEAHPYYVPDLNVPVTIMDYIKGDVNIDGTVNVSDYVATANYILELDPHPFLFVAADIDENLAINVSDLVGVANIALNFMGAPAVNHAPAMGYDGDGLMSFTADCSTISPNKHVVTLDLSNSSAVTAFQMDIHLPEGLKLVNASLSDRATVSHSLEMTTLASGAYRLLGASMMSKAFVGSEGTLLTLEIEGATSGMAIIDGIMLAEPDATLHKHDAMTLAFDNSGVQEMMSDVSIYLQDGMVVVESPVASKVQFILPNGMSVVHEVKPGRNIYNTGLEGVVIVKVGSQVKKFKL